MPIQKPKKYLAVRKYRHTSIKEGATEVIEVSANEVYSPGQYYAKGEYMKQQDIDRMLSIGILIEQPNQKSEPEIKKAKDEK